MYLVFIYYNGGFSTLWYFHLLLTLFSMVVSASEWGIEWNSYCTLNTLAGFDFGHHMNSFHTVLYSNMISMSYKDNNDKTVNFICCSESDTGMKTAQHVHHFLLQSVNSLKSPFTPLIELLFILQKWMSEQASGFRHSSVRRYVVRTPL